MAFDVAGESYCSKVTDSSSPSEADSPSRPETRSQSVQRTAALETDPSYIDVVNLSNQLVSMEILPAKEDSKKSRKRVRFALPDNPDEASPTVSKRGKSSDVKNAKKFCIKKTILRKFHPYGQRKVEPVDKTCVENQGNPLLKKSYCLPVVDGPESNELVLMSEELAENLALDKNDNCTMRSDGAKTTKRPNFPLKKSKSDSLLIKRKSQSYSRPVKKRKYVVSKKSWVKRKEVTRYKSNLKRKHGDYGNSTLKKAKKRKISVAHLKAKERNKNLVKNNRSYSTNKPKKIGSKYHGSKRKQVKSKSSSKVKQIKNKIKKAADKVRKAKALKQKMSQLKKRLKKAAQKKLALKQKLAKKQKQKKKQKKKVQRREKVAKRHIDKQIKKRRRKIHIIPIERELDVVEPLRISLLKFLTFEKAYEDKLDCCRKYCWDDWEEIDMEDILADHD